MMAVKFYDFSQVSDEQLIYVVACAGYDGKWVFCRHKARTSWELPGGKREAGETVEQAMRRELWEETGADADVLTPVCAYSVTDAGKTTFGALFYAQLREPGCLPPESEIGEIQLLPHLPRELTYPQIQPELYAYIQGWLNRRSSPDELWDVYDENRVAQGRLHRRAEPMGEGEYHLVVHVWILGSDGRFLLTKRDYDKGFPGMWESTGGSALAGDDSLTAALREVREEMGLSLDPRQGCCVLTERKQDYFRDVWLFRQEFDLKDVVLQPGETVDKMKAGPDQIRKLLQQEAFVPYDYLEELFSLAGLTEGGNAV